MDELARLLGHERRLLELLLFKLVEGRYLLAGELDLPEEALTMSFLARDSLEPYTTIFSDHRQAFLGLAAEIEDVARQNPRLAELGPAAGLTMPSLVDWLKSPSSVLDQP